MRCTVPSGQKSQNTASITEKIKLTTLLGKITQSKVKGRTMTELLRMCGLPLDASALAALDQIEDATNAYLLVPHTIRTKLRPHWADLDDLAKELIFLHALNTESDELLWPVLSAATEEARQNFHIALALLCERHNLEEIGRTAKRRGGRSIWRRDRFVFGSHQHFFACDRRRYR